MIRRLLEMLPMRTIFGRQGAYLTKYKLLDLGKERIRIYIHQFHRSDEDVETHSHPWDWAIALVLRGGYVETRDLGGYFRRRVLWPGSFNLIQHNDFHRVELIESESWSLFIAGPERHDWCFLHPETRERWDWKAFISAKGLVPS